MSAGDNPSMPRRCRCGKIGVPGALIKGRAIGANRRGGKARVADCTQLFYSSASCSAFWIGAMKPAGQMTITLTPELEQFVRSEVERGGFASDSEYVRDFLRERYLKVREREEARASLEASLKQALRDIDEGRETELDDAFKQVRECLNLPAE